MKEQKIRGKTWLPQRIKNDYMVQRVFKDEVVRRRSGRKSCKLTEVPRKDVMDMLVGIDRAWYA